MCNNVLKKLVIVGNGFDLAHGLKTTYRDFINWYICGAFKKFCSEKNFSDNIFEIKNRAAGYTTSFSQSPNTFNEVFQLININDHQSFTFKSDLLKDLVDGFNEKSWVDIERQYFQSLKIEFAKSIDSKNERISRQLNEDFNDITDELGKYMSEVNSAIEADGKLVSHIAGNNFNDLFFNDGDQELKVLNFNYTDTLVKKGYTTPENIIHIHGRSADTDNYPIIFGYGDETDPMYQQIEDSGDNYYLDHIKSFGYFQTDSYAQLLSFIASNPYKVFILGHSCGLSDRVLLREVFEHDNCEKIELFYYHSKEGFDNFKVLTQEISRHFRPNKKDIMRRKIGTKSFKNLIPQA